jgi:uncharacterized protein
MSTTERTQVKPGSAIRPLPKIDPLSKFFWDGTAQHRLLILQCQTCGKYNHWPRPICRFCLSDKQSPAEVSGRGTVWSYTVVTYAYHPGLQPPYVLASIELEEQAGLRLVSNIVESAEEDLAVGMQVEVLYEDLPAGVTLPLFRAVR